MSEVYRLKGGTTEYESYYDALAVARAKADTRDEAVEVCRRAGNDISAVARVDPDGVETRLDE